MQLTMRFEILTVTVTVIIGSFVCMYKTFLLYHCSDGIQTVMCSHTVC
jgi:hypothetical protein